MVSDTKNSQKETHKFLGNLQNKENRRGVEEGLFIYNFWLRHGSGVSAPAVSQILKI